MTIAFCCGHLCLWTKLIDKTIYVKKDMSIIIRPNTTNYFALTLNESSTLTPPNRYFQFEFINTFTTESIIWVPSGDSSNSCRFNLFQMVETFTGSTTGGIDLPLNLVESRYTYNVREATGQTLEISETTGRILETGIMNVMSTNIFTNNINNIYI